MRTTKEVQQTITKKVTTYECDFCDYHTQKNTGCCGEYPVMQCELCSKDACYKHRDFITDDHTSDYPYGIRVCINCKPVADKAWKWAQENALWKDDIFEVTKNKIKEMLDESQKHNAT